MNFRLADDLVDYIDKWHRATGRSKEDVFNQMLRAYKNKVGDPPEPINLPDMPSARTNRK